MKSFHPNSVSCSGAVVVILAVLTLVSTCEGADILLTGQTAEPGGGDPLVIDHLEDLGHTVSYLGTENSDVFGDDVLEGGFDLHIMSSTSNTSTMRDNGFDTIPTPILTWESSMVRDVPGEFYITDDQQSGDNGTEIFIVDASHPILTGLNVKDGDILEIFTDPQNFFGLTGEIAPGANLIATGTEDDFLEERIMIVEIPQGGEVLFAEDSDFEGGLSPGARVHIPLSDTSFEFLNDAGLQIFNNAVNFALCGAANCDTDPCDFDGDGALGIGDLDLLSAEIQAGTNNAAFDVTGDGAVNPSDLQFFVSNESKLHTFIGDANLDGEFNSTDLVALFTAGQYEDGVAGNSTWATGDFNADGEFDSGDLVAAFTDGGYELGPKWDPNAAPVPEPSAFVLLLLGWVTVAVLRRSA